MNNVNRSRDRAITIRLNEYEYDDIMSKIDKSGMTKQAYLINAARGATITSSEEITILKEISKTFANVERQLRGLGTNVNQLAHVANGYGDIPTESQLDNLSGQINEFREECEDVWQLIRSSINQQKPTGQCET